MKLKFIINHILPTLVLASIYYNPSCKLTTCTLIKYQVQVHFNALSFSPTEKTIPYSSAQQKGFKFHYAISYLDLFTNPIYQQYDINTEIIPAYVSQTSAKISVSSLYIQKVNYVSVRVILYSPFISSNIFIGQQNLSGNYSSIFTQTIVITSATNFSGALIQTYITGLRTYQYLNVSVQTLPTGTSFVNSLNQFVVTINIQDPTPPYGYCLRIKYNYIVIKKQMFVYPGSKIQFSIQIVELPASPSLSNVWTNYSPSNNILFINSLVQFGLFKLMIDPFQTLQHGINGLFTAPGAFYISYYNFKYGGFSLILANNIHMLGNCCGVNYYDWNQNICGICSMTSGNYINQYPNNFCLWMCSRCCTAPYLQCYSCVGPQIKLVTGGCTNVRGCVEVISSSNSSQCIRCEIGFINLNLVTNVCQCPSGYLQVTGLCTNVRGCTGTKKQGNTVKCIECDINKLYVNDGNGNCVCMKGFRFNVNSLRCQQVCGDGKVFTLACDDGNNIDGDGCSSTCESQKYFRCKINSTSYSICKIQLKSIQFYIYKIQRIGFTNRAKFTLKLSSMPNIQLPSNVITNINFFSGPSNNLSSWEMKNGLVFIYIDFRQSLEDNIANIAITLDNRTIANNIRNVNFTIKSDNTKLLYSDPNTSTSGYVVLILYCLHGFGTLLCFFTNKLNGPHNIHAILIVVILYVFSLSKNINIISLGYLSVYNLNILYHKQLKLNIYHKNITNFGQDQLYTSIYINAFLSVVCFILILLRLAINKTIKNIQNNQQIINILKNTYHRFIFPLCFSFIYISLINFMYTKFDNYSIKVSNIFSLMINLILCFNEFFGCLFQTQEPEGENSWSGVQQCKNSYLSYYILYIWVFIGILCVGTLGIIESISRYIGGITLIFLVYFISCLPFKRTRYNVLQIINLMLIFYCSTWFSLRQFFDEIEQYESNYIYYGLNLIICLNAITSFYIFVKDKFFNEYQQPQEQQINCQIDKEQIGNQLINNLKVENERNFQQENIFIAKQKIKQIIQNGIIDSTRKRKKPTRDSSKFRKYLLSKNVVF